jgi:hypothetical protein
VGDGLTGIESSLKSGLAGDVAADPHMMPLSRGNKRGIFGLRNLVIDLDAVVSPASVVVDERDVFVTRVGAIELRCDGVNSRAKQLTARDVLSRNRCSGLQFRLKTVVTRWRHRAAVAGGCRNECGSR